MQNHTCKRIPEEFSREQVQPRPPCYRKRTLNGIERPSSDSRLGGARLLLCQSATNPNATAKVQDDQLAPRHNQLRLFRMVLEGVSASNGSCK